MRKLTPVLFLALLLALFSSCKKSSTPDAPSGCNAVVQQLNHFQSTSDPNDYLAATWNSDATVSSLKMFEAYSFTLSISFTYSGGRISAGAIKNSSDVFLDSAIFHYNATGKVDSMYTKTGWGRGIAITYTSGSITKISWYNGTSLAWYWNIVSDAAGNITAGDAYEWDSGTSAFVRTAHYDYTRDDKKNPLAGLSAYMLYLDDDYAIYRTWGPNNNVNQHYVDYSGGGFNITTGYSYTYNSNCYPTGAKNTINGVPIFATDDYTFTYY
jgi:hypothetical protein